MPMPRVMPKRRKLLGLLGLCRAAGPRPEQIDLTYWMNSLQPIPMDDPLFVTLNSNSPIREDLIYDTVHLPPSGLRSGRAARRRPRSAP